MARQYSYFILVLVYPLLSSCGGGGGTSASAPPVFTPTPPILGNLLGGATTSALFQNLPDDGPRWLALVDADSGYIPLRGNAASTEDTLKKLPPPTPLGDITTRFSKISYVQNQLQQIADPGRYIIWGTRNTLALQQPLSFTIKGQWTCSYCGGAQALRHGELQGQLSVNPADDRGTVTLTGDGLEIAASLARQKNNQLSSQILPTILRLDGQALTPIRSDILGSLFGPNVEEAGIVFGIADDQGRIFSGGATGHKIPTQ